MTTPQDSGTSGDPQPWPSQDPAGAPDAYAEQSPQQPPPGAYGQSPQQPPPGAYGQQPPQQPPPGAYGQSPQQPPPGAYGQPPQQPPPGAYGQPPQQPPPGAYGQSPQQPPPGAYGQPPQQFGPPAEQPVATPPDVGEKRSHTGMIVSVVAAVVVLILAAGALFVWPGFLQKTVVKEQSLVDGVRSVLVNPADSDPVPGYGRTDVDTVTCPGDQEVVKGNEFTCTVVLTDGSKRYVTGTFTDSEGTYTVSRPTSSP